MNSTRFHRLFAVVAFFACVLPVSAKQRIEVSAFYMHPLDMSKFDVITEDYTMHHIQLRIVHTFDAEVSMADYAFPQIGNGLALSLPNLVFANMRVKNDTGWHKVSPFDFGKEENRKRIFHKIAYSYSPANDGSFGVAALCNKNHVAPALYTQSDKGNWYAVSKERKDTIEVFFNIDPSLFYVRTSKCPSFDDMGKASLTILPGEKIPDFYLFYLPAYKHFVDVDEEKGRKLDFLFENIEDEKCVLSESEYVVKYYPNDSVAKERLSYLKQMSSGIDEFARKNIIPQNLHVVLSSQAIASFTGEKIDTTVFSMANKEEQTKYAILLVDRSMFYNQTLIHELLHTCFPTTANNSFNDYFFRESVTEYIASYIYETLIDTVKVFNSHKNLVDKYYQSTNQIKQIFKKNAGIFVDSDPANSSFWIYYDFFPMRLHSYALKGEYDEKTFVKDLINYMIVTESPSFNHFSTCMKEKGYKNIDKVWKSYLQ